MRLHRSFVPLGVVLARCSTRSAKRACRRLLSARCGRWRSKWAADERFEALLTAFQCPPALSALRVTVVRRRHRLFPTLSSPPRSRIRRLKAGVQSPASDVRHACIQKARPNFSMFAATDASSPGTASYAGLRSASWICSMHEPMASRYRLYSASVRPSLRDGTRPPSASPARYASITTRRARSGFMEFTFNRLAARDRTHANDRCWPTCAPDAGGLIGGDPPTVGRPLCAAYLPLDAGARVAIPDPSATFAPSN